MATTRERARIMDATFMTRNQRTNVGDELDKVYGDARCRNEGGCEWMAV